MIGTSIAHYRINARIGAGGMGEVWRATDTKLGRDVALKILPEIFSSDAQRMARFQREAQLLASLNHPNIAAIYGVEEFEGRRALVLELVEGDDLHERLRSGPIPIEEALEIARQIAEALESAHERGIVHRDLKPANVKLTAGGAVKVLDFGLAKALEGDPGSGVTDPGQSLSPTLTQAATKAGMILGTAAYMSPEQAKGKGVDRRADIFSFGVVLFEMLARTQCFSGETISDTLASVLKVEPSWELLPSGTAQPVVDLLRRCLEKDPKQRLQSIGEARIAIQNAIRGRSGSMAASLAGTASGTTATAAKPGPGAAVLGGALVVVGLLAGLAGWLLKPAPDAVPPRRFIIAHEHLSAEYRSSPAVSPDGTRIAFVAGGRLRVRDLDRLEPREIQGSEGAVALSWSPDGSALAFIAEGKLQRASAAGGAPTVLTELDMARIDATAWSEDGHIYLAPAQGPLYRVSAQGGDPQEFLPLQGDGETDFHTPAPLPGGDGLLYAVHRPGGSDTIEAWRDGKRKILLRLVGERIEHAVYAPGGYMVYLRRTNNAGVWAAPFSLERLELTGDPFLLDSEGAYPGVATDGTLIYTLGAGAGLRQLVWVDRAGAVVGTIGQPQEGMSFPEVSPDGTQVLVSENPGEARDIWIYDVDRGTRTRATFSEDFEWSGAWLPDGKRIAFTIGAAGVNQSFSRSADGTDEPVKLGDFSLPSFRVGVPSAVVVVRQPETDNDLMVIPLEGGGAPEPLLVAPHRQGEPQLSPDGRYLAYVSDESGERQVYLKKFPSGEGKWQVSLDGGGWPRWSPDGAELYFVETTGNDALMAVKVTTSPSLRLSTPEKLFEGMTIGAVPRMYDVHPDGKRFLAIQEVGEEREREPRIVVVQNWTKAFGR